MPVTIDLDTYSARAESFVSAIDREYYQHYSGRKADFEIAKIYERHTDLFAPEAVEFLRERVAASAGDEHRRLRYLLQLAIEGQIGEATKMQAERLAEREGELEIEVNGRREPYRQAVLLQANEPDADRRSAIERAQLDALDRELNPLLVEVHEAAGSRARQLGWSSYLDMYGELKGFDLAELGRQTASFLEATEDSYARVVDAPLKKQLGYGIDALRRSDVSRFMRAPGFDDLFPEARLTDALLETLAGLGIDVASQPQVTLDLEPRPLKASRAFCAPVRVPDEVYLVMPVNGGREDYATLFHEAGHTEHYACVDPSLPFEFRYLGDNSVTESFAFLFEHLTEDPDWTEATLGVSAPAEYLEFARAVKIIFLRRYAAKLAYELQLHSAEPLASMPALYASGLSRAVRCDWPQATYLADVDDGFYVTSYLRAWALETYWRTELRERFGNRWFERREAGDFLRELWADGQRLRADELLEEKLGKKLDFAVMLAEVS